MTASCVTASENDVREKLYQDSIKVDVEMGFARILKQEELEAAKLERQWYVPHHPVENPNKPGKVRRVCNAASKFRGISLNDNLLTGPDLLQNLIGIIFRFREQKIAIIAKHGGDVPRSESTPRRL